MTEGSSLLRVLTLLKAIFKQGCIFFRLLPSRGGKEKILKKREKKKLDVNKI